jgi:hypothetical protein
MENEDLWVEYITVVLPAARTPQAPSIQGDPTTVTLRVHLHACMPCTYIKSPLRIRDQVRGARQVESIGALRTDDGGCAAEQSHCEDVRVA